MTLIAIVDDEESVRKAMARLIHSAGFSVATFFSGVDFLRSLSQRQPACVVLDLHMLHMSGFDVQDALQWMPNRPPVIIISADDSPASRSRALRQGALDYLLKPMDDMVLLAAIRRAIRSS